MTQENALQPLIERLVAQSPATSAQTLEAFEADEAAQLLGILPPSLAREVFDNWGHSFSADVLEKLAPETMGSVLDGIAPERAAALFLELSQEHRKPYLRCFSTKERRSIREFLDYPEDSAGRIMSTQFTALPGTTRVKDAIAKIRAMREKRTPTSYLYVVDEEKRLIGIMNVWDMVLADDRATLQSVMRKEVFSVNCFQEQESVADELANRKYFAVPVVDNQSRLLGIIRADDLMESAQEEASENIQRMFGAGGDEKAFSPMSFSLKQRLPWLHANLATAFMAAAVVGFFEDLIAKITVLAVFLPVVAGQGGNAGAQSLAVVMRGLVMREIPSGKAWTLVRKEALIGLINGLVIGVVTGLIAWIWQGNAYLGVVIGLGMIVTLILAGLSGAGIPLLMKHIGLDPAQSSNILLTTITDVIGFLAFLGFAMAFQSKLL